MFTETPVPAQILGLLPPHSIEAEQSTLGALMLANDRWDDIGEIVTVESFYRVEHRRIFAAMATLAAEDKPLPMPASCVSNSGGVSLPRWGATSASRQ